METEVFITGTVGDQTRQQDQILSQVIDKKAVFPGW